MPRDVRWMDGVASGALARLLGDARFANWSDAEPFEGYDSAPPSRPEALVASSHVFDSSGGEGATGRSRETDPAAGSVDAEECAATATGGGGGS